MAPEQNNNYTDRLVPGFRLLTDFTATTKNNSRLLPLHNQYQ